ncbi:alpha/beta hydrolase [Reticulibacter mediterranei]|uniref:Alpha/beta hydrolase n=1 Tax=Reticulibacter mediterranei TaxID=2778369 RepID=A0A8J3J2H3_9CHLR|nr:alpha/beta fold hydrolase [Reticulibacter mediterranei]GHP01101.1 alpha/beta hydrolase [Reticulibacter mediterranei]
MGSFKPPIRRLVLQAIFIAMLLVAESVVGSRPARAETVSCQAFPRIAVALTNLGKANYHVWGELCATPAELARPDGTATVQLLVSGATYSHVYWDFSPTPIDGVSYSYARDEAAAGYPTFVLDRIGIGNSDHPLSALVDVKTNATIVHQVVQGLKNGSITGTRFAKVIEVSHSLGSLITWVEVVNYHDVDGVIITDMLHRLTPAFLARLPLAISPARLDSRFAGRPWATDVGYLTIKPPLLGNVAHGFRAQFFYNTATADVKVIALDEKTKETLTLLEFDSILHLVVPDTRLIKVPVQVMIGEKDFLLCDAILNCHKSSTIQQEEAPFYSSAACLQVVSIPQSGHDLSLHPNNRLQVQDALSWSDQFVGRSTTSRPPGCPSR